MQKIDRDFACLSFSAACAATGESPDEILKLIYAGDLQGFLPFEKGGWFVTVGSIERYLGYGLDIRVVQRSQVE